jgi:hypothetical protein
VVLSRCGPSFLLFLAAQMTDLAPLQLLPRAVQPAVVLSRWVCRASQLGKPSCVDLAPLRRGFFMRVLRALCNQLRGSALSLAGLLCVNVVRLAPLRRGAFSMNKETNSAAGRWGGGLAAYRRERQARYGNKHDPPSPAPLAGLLFGDPYPFRWLPADARRMPFAVTAAARWSFSGGEASQ